jgi:hypothetical protein
MLLIPMDAQKTSVVLACMGFNQIGPSSATGCRVGPRRAGVLLQAPKRRLEPSPQASSPWDAGSAVGKRVFLLGQMLSRPTANAADAATCGAAAISARIQAERWKVNSTDRLGALCCPFGEAQFVKTCFLSANMCGHQLGQDGSNRVAECCTVAQAVL